MNAGKAMVQAAFTRQRDRLVRQFADVPSRMAGERLWAVLVALDVAHAQFLPAVAGATLKRGPGEDDWLAEVPLRPWSWWGLAGSPEAALEAMWLEVARTAARDDAKSRGRGADK